MHTPVNPQFYCIKVGFTGVKITYVCFRDDKENEPRCEKYKKSILRILPPKNENFQLNYSGSFHISAQNINCRFLLEPPRQKW